MTVSATTYVQIPEVTTYIWTLSPVLQSAVTISSGNIPVRLMLSTLNTRTYSIPVTLRCGAATVTTATGSIALTNGAAPVAFDLNLPLASAYTCASGSTIYLDVRNTQTGTGTRDILVYPAPASGVYSYVSLTSQNVINVDSVSFYNAAYSGGTQITTASPGQTIYVRATVSDPFGAYDITGATLAMMNPSGAVQSPTPAAMTETSYSNAASKIYEYSFTLPTGAGALGTWRAQVNATEGTEKTVSNYGTNTINVVGAAAVLSIVKTAVPSPSVSSGQVITYSMLVTNTTAGTATSVNLNDTLSPYIDWGVDSYGLGFAFQFVDSITNPSGLTMGTATYNNGTYTPTPGSGYDANVTNFQLPMAGTMNGSGANFTINYKVRVK
jgi:uncharacterized repeat protein (TIGR01451 family)